MNYLASLFFSIIILLWPVRAMGDGNNDHTISSNSKFKILKNGLNCPLDIDLKR